MCGGYSIAIVAAALEKRFGVTLSRDIVPRYNAAPSQMLPVILNADPGHIVFSRWGITPAWMSRLSRKDGLINVRFETLRDRPTFHADLSARRCLVPADGFYEWKTGAGKKKIPYRITRRDGKPFAFAGIWEEDSYKGALPRFAIITTAADKFMQPIHSRMPVILNMDEERAWIGRDGELSDFLRLLDTPYGSPLRAYEVSRSVNRASVDIPDLLQPVDHAADDAPLFKSIGK